MSFWIRLTTGIGRNQIFVHDDLGDYALTVSILEMAIHERSHYDVTSYNPQEGHCDGYQAWYNSLMQDAVHKLDKYKRLTDFIMGTADNTNWYIIIVTRPTPYDLNSIPHTPTPPPVHTHTHAHTPDLRYFKGLRLE